MALTRADENEQVPAGHEELTKEQFIDKVARLIAVTGLLEQQIQAGQVQVTQEMQAITVEINMGVTMMMISPIINISGDLGKEYTDLKHQVEAHSNDARAAADTNARVQEAINNYTLFRQAHPGFTPRNNAARVQVMHDANEDQDEDLDNNRGQNEQQCRPM